MNNQKNSQYGYVNINGRLVPTNQSQKQRVVNNTTNSTAREQAKRPQQSRPQQSTPQQSTQQQSKPKQTYAEKAVAQAEKKNNKKRNGIKNLCLYLSVFMILSTAKQLPFNVNAKVTELASKNGAHNYMDDVFASDEEITIVNPKNGKQQKIQLEDAIDKLEDYVEICTLIDSLNINELDYVELTDKEAKAAIDLYNEKGIEGVISLYKNNKGNSIERARTARQLIFIRDYFGGEWLNQNGLHIVESVLEKTIQTAAIENYGTFSPLEYGVATIPEENEYPYFTVELTDPVSGASDNVFFTPIACGEYAQAMLTLRDLKSTDQERLTQTEKLDKIKHGLRIIKKCLNKEVEDFHGITYTKKVRFFVK